VAWLDSSIGAFINNRTRHEGVVTADLNTLEKLVDIQIFGVSNHLTCAHNVHTLALMLS